MIINDLVTLCEKNGLKDRLISYSKTFKDAVTFCQENGLIDTSMITMDRSDCIKDLKEYLTNSNVKVNHKEFMKLATLKEACVWCVRHRVSSQRFGTLIEKYIRGKFNYQKNKPADCTGDCFKDGKNSEVKVSLGGMTGTKFNFTQIRPTHDCDYILVAYHLSPDNVEALGELYVFKVPALEMKKLILSHCKGYAHGSITERGKVTIDSLNDKKNAFALRPKINNDCWKALMVFRVPETSL